MKNTTRKLLAIMLVLVLALSNLITVYGLDNISAFDSKSMDDRIAALHGYEFMSNHNQSVEIIYGFYNSLPRNRAGEFVYPGQFGGMYINDDGILVLLTVDTPLTRTSPMPEVFSNARMDNRIEVRQADFPYSELMHITDMLNATIPNMDSQYTGNISGWTLDVKGNRVVVRLKEYNDEQIEFFKRSIFHFPAMVFVQCDGREMSIDRDFDIPPLVTSPPAIDVYGFTESEYIGISPTNATVTVWPGRRVWLYRRQPNGSLVRTHRIGSVGYQATRQGRRGVTVAAHTGLATDGVPVQTGDVFAVDGNHGNTEWLGTVSIAALDWVDTAFVEFDGPPGWVNFVASVPQAPLLPTVIPPVVGRIVFTVGAITGVTDGHINEIRSSFSIPVTTPGGALVRTIWLTDTILARQSGNSTAVGDSGGLVYAQVPGMWEAGIVGTHAGVYIRNNVRFNVISQASNIGRILGAWPA